MIKNNHRITTESRQLNNLSCSTLIKKTIARQSFSLFFSNGHGRRNFVMARKQLWNNFHSTYRQATEWVEYIITLPILTINPSNLTIVVTIKSWHCLLDMIECMLAARFPILTLKNHDEVVPTDMTNKIKINSYRFSQRFTHQLNQLIATSKAISIVKWFKVIQITITGPKCNVFFK